MTTLLKAAQQALEALVSQFDGRADAIDILSAALAQQAEPQTTHSAECWRWHHACAVAKIERENKA